MQQDTQLRHLKMQVQRKLNQCLQLAETYFERSFPPPTVNYKIRGRKAGAAYLQQNEIRLNPILLLENPNEFIQQVVPHEFAHLLTYQIFGRVKPHGAEWKRLMTSLFQLEPNVYHQFDVSNVSGQIIAYQCDCQIHQLTVRRHNNIVKKNVIYFCKNCKSKLIRKT